VKDIRPPCAEFKLCTCPAEGFAKGSCFPTKWLRHVADSDAESVWARGRGWAARLEQAESSTLSLIVRLVDHDIRQLVLGGLLRWFSAMESHILSSEWKKAVLHSMSRTGARPNGILIPKDVEILKHEDGTDRVLNSGASQKVGMRKSPTLSQGQGLGLSWSLDVNFGRK
jgi:hypothetical protein